MPKRAVSKKAEIKIRLTERLRKKVQRAAHINGVSMNAEMIKRLQFSFDQESRVRDAIQEDTTSAIEMIRRSV